ncbi:MAG: AAA family ATPase [Phycisphaerae bacterium]
MIESIQFQNFRCLRDTTLPLRPFTLIVGPNGSGKTTAVQSLRLVREALLTSTNPSPTRMVQTAGAGGLTETSISVRGRNQHGSFAISLHWSATNFVGIRRDSHPATAAALPFLAGVRTFSLDAEALAQPVRIVPRVELAYNGRDLSGVLDWLGDREPERWETLNASLREWFPEYNRIVLDWVAEGEKQLFLRRSGKPTRIGANDLSAGTLYVLAMLTLAHLPEPPTLVAIEEPDHGIHPRLLRLVYDALNRLAFPAEHGESRSPVQVIATTHSPYFLNLFRDHPEDVVIASKSNGDAKFQRLVDTPHADEILSDSPPLGDVWYSGILGGVPEGT